MTTADACGMLPKLRQRWGCSNGLRTVVSAVLATLLAACHPALHLTPLDSASTVPNAPAIAPTPAATTAPAPAPIAASAPENQAATLARLRARLQAQEPVCETGPFTAQWLDYYASPRARLGERLDAILSRLDFVERQLRERDLPAEFALIPLIESDYRPDAIGRGGPAGMWQMLPATARAHGAAVDASWDRRLSMLESTLAALDYLQMLYAHLGDWRNAAMAFNAGEQRITRALAAAPANTSGEWRAPPGIPKGTIEYVGKLQALRCLIAAPQAHALVLPEHAPDVELVSVPLPPTAHTLAAIAEALQTTPATLRALNGGMKQAFVPSSGPRRLLVPSPEPDALAALQRLREPEPPQAVHVVRRGDSLWSIARRYGLRTIDLQRLNSLGASTVLRVGQSLRLGQ